MLNVEIEIISADAWIDGEQVVQGDVCAVAPHVASRMIARGIAKKVGVAEVAEPEVSTQVDNSDEAAEDDDES